MSTNNDDGPFQAPQPRFLEAPWEYGARLAREFERWVNGAFQPLPDPEPTPACEGADIEPLPAEGLLDEVCKLPNGSMLYRRADEDGGQRYLSDEVGGGGCVVVWDTNLVDRATLLSALVEEERREQGEYERICGEGQA